VSNPYIGYMRKGDVVSDFELADQTGTPRKLSELLSDGPVVLFFYPAAMTYGCTKESCHFRDLDAEFAAVGARRVGISADSVDKQKQFDEKESLGFTLLSDSDFAVAKELGASRSASFLPNKRMTFVIDTDRTLLEVIHSEFSMGGHADKALSVLRERKVA
jgi:thioredoxin-dependent peroxiredoxin